MGNELLLFLPESVVLLGALLVFVLSVGACGPRATRLAGLAAALVALGAALFSLYYGPAGEPFAAGILRVDTFSQLLKAGLALGLLLTLLLAGELKTVRAGARVDLPFFLLLATVGMMLLVSATELLTLFVALELSAYSLYAAVALHREHPPGDEAGVRYVLIGAAASAVTLYGLSLIFGAVGSTYLADVTAALVAGRPLVLVVGLVLLLAALFFKLAVFPFHFWAPDVYQGAPHQVVAFVATASKLGAVGVLARICAVLAAAPSGMVEVLLVLAVVSMTLGNLAALAQSDLKRLLAYSAIAHGGYLLLGYGAFSELGIAAALFYGVVYLATAILGFVVVCALGREGSNPDLDALAGLHQRSPVLALMLLAAMFGLAGIPPAGGFVGKWFLFAAALERGQFELVLLAAGNTTLALYYYLRVVKAAYLAPAGGRGPLALSGTERVAGYIALAIVLGTGIYPAPLWAMAQRAAGVLLAG
ncbi:MAG: NADH-quinone oxidoreductase subunit N [Proteobacteria bacterium]|nr:NADH-quinone oxidoreductase subunit N [Pseudomonadota bacterium]